MYKIEISNTQIMFLWGCKTEFKKKSIWFSLIAAIIVLIRKFEDAKFLQLYAHLIVEFSKVTIIISNKIHLSYTYT